MKRRIHREECWEVSGCWEERILAMQTNAGKTVKVNYRLEIPAGFLGQKWKLEVSGKAKPLRPVGWIRKVKGTVDMLGEVTP